PVIFVYTGPVRSGKTTALRARFGADPAAAGLLAPDVDGRRHLLSLASGETRPLEADAPADPVAVGRFTFDGAVFAWARAELATACRAAPATLIVDEVGPLELDGRGLEPAVGAAVRLAASTRVVLVVREGLLDRVLDHYGVRDHARIVRHAPRDA
ncbi:MAG TPA: nucleoside-triphosphatase, partial [Rubricoccaceae bacterium]